MIKTYLLFAITATLTSMITYNIVKYDVHRLVPWCAAGVFFLLWRYAAMHTDTTSRSKTKRLY